MSIFAHEDCIKILKYKNLFKKMIIFKFTSFHNTNNSIFVFDVTVKLCVESVIKPFSLNFSKKKAMDESCSIKLLLQMCILVLKHPMFQCSHPLLFYTLE